MPRVVIPAQLLFITMKVRFMKMKVDYPCKVEEKTCVLGKMKLLSKEIFDFANVFISTATNLLKSEDQTEIFSVSIYLSGSIGGKSDPARHA